MNLATKIVLGLILAAMLAHFIWAAFFSRKMQGRVSVCQVQVHTLRSYIEEYRRNKGALPKDPLKELPSVISPWELAYKSFICPFDKPGEPPRVSSVFDGSGGWFYDTATGHIYPNYKRIRIWVSPFWFRTEDPSKWSQEPLQ